MNHEAMSDIGFSSEIYCGSHKLDNEFFVNRMSSKRKQANHQQANRKAKKKPFRSQLSKASHAVRDELFLDGQQKADSTQGSRFDRSTPSLMLLVATQKV